MTKKGRVNKTPEQILLEEGIAREQVKRNLSRMKLSLIHKKREMKMRIDTQLLIWEKAKALAGPLKERIEQAESVVGRFLDQDTAQGQMGLVVIGRYIPEHKLMSIKETIELEIEELERDIKEIEEINKKDVPGKNPKVA